MPDDWVKTALLYWDKLATIVPVDYGEYHSKTCRELVRLRILEPLHVHPWSTPEINEVGEEAMAFLDSQEGVSVHKYSFPPGNQEWLDERYVRIHPDKLSDPLKVWLASHGSRHGVRGGWLTVSPEFAAYYMTLLASKLALNTGKALLTDSGAQSRLASSSALWHTSRSMRHSRLVISGDIAQGVLATTVLKTIKIDRRLTLKQILQFKDKHSDELGRFRDAIRELTKGIQGDIPIEVLSEHIQGIYKDQVLPAIHQLEDRLRLRRIQYEFTNLGMSTLLKATTPTVLGCLLEYAGYANYSVAGGAALSVVVAAAMYSTHRAETLLDNTFSYVIHAKSALA